MMPNSTAQEILAKAHEREAQRERLHVPIDYAASQVEYRKQKAALTRAINSKDPDKVVVACKAAVAAWNKPGRSWPDTWANWQRALDDALGWRSSVQLEDL
jgi:hypothetical protein